MVRRVLVFLIPAAFTAVPVRAQTCGVQLVKQASLGDERDALIGYPVAVTHHQNFFLLAHVADQSEVLVFDSAGALLNRIGSPGSGPGEFRTVVEITRWRGDSIAFWDPGNGRLAIQATIASEPRYVAILGTRDAIVLDDGSVVVNTRFNHAPGMALHTLGADGTIRFSYDGDGSYRRDQPARYRRSLAPAGNNRFWSAHQTSYRLELRNAAGSTLEVLSFSPKWFPEGLHYGLEPADPRNTPHPGVVDIEVDPGGLLIVVIHVPDPRWRSALGTRPGLYGRPGISIENEHLFWDTMVEVLDPANGMLLASRRFDEAILGLADGDHAYSYRESTDGQPSLELWRVAHTCGGPNAKRTSIHDSGAAGNPGSGSRAG